MKTITISARSSNAVAEPDLFVDIEFPSNHEEAIASGWTEEGLNRCITTSVNPIIAIQGVLRTTAAGKDYKGQADLDKAANEKLGSLKKGEGRQFSGVTSEDTKNKYLGAVFAASISGNTDALELIERLKAGEKDETLVPAFRAFVNGQKKASK